MKYLNCFISNIVILVKKLFGCRISCSILNLISPFASIRTYKKGKISLGTKVQIRSFSEVCARGGKVDVGNNCFINRGCMIVSHEEIQIGDNTTIGPGVYIYDHNHLSGGLFETSKITIGNNVWIGANCTILKGVHIGDNVTVAAGCVVTHDIEDNVMIYQKREDISIKK